ncbi:putative Permease of the major facilitator superfamily [Thiomonas arsenitoxydans]|uniref:Permease of the major facilitator superfamily n=1 Tax=Thiomonas arsenitoxydans (strain DSM 22701 / CIP 110005 / 3As) TaxID=426114 RepID=D6CPF8_THIA3|nr:MFS transporter [Thiomonas arsenitoxydans]CAZ87888.1 putative Permease of the major facilitator superfamily [Thiomonas arsenitoxydans]CQR26582.1 putative Permease of the major facilitator superfamily [Thiomonas arsenitoxydans]CQR27334.1 putative Permease of the major facilitator superfamily [Thiomonas arsenitoxydans]CQR31268.1 putative Permease of the major facilitator superfamily [Thiomonas arsenitoxydans]CQR31280.1 putative Permease of the major facilitator superfamily [Thiomonas arsenito
MRRWTPFVLLMPFQFIFGLIYSWGTISPAIHVQSGWPQATLDLAFSLTPLGLLPAVILAGRALHRLAPKTLLAWALTCFTVGGGIGLLTASPVAFMLGYSLLALGVGAGLSTAACIALVSRLYPQRRGSLGGALLALYGMSSVISAPLFDEINRLIGWRPSLAALLGLYAAVGWIAWAFLPVAPAAPRRQTDPLPLMVLLKQRPLQWALVIVLMATPLGSASFATIGHLTKAIGVSSALGVLAVSLMALGNGVGRLGFGFLADWISPRFSRAAALGLNALAALLLLGVLHGYGVGAFAAYPLLIGLAFGGMAGKLPALAAHVAERHSEAAFGLLFGAFAFASFLGPFLSAGLGMHSALQGLALCALAAMGLGLVVAR